MRAAGFLAILSFTASALAAACPAQDAAAVTIGAQRWRVEAASSPAQRQRGLSSRPALGPAAGMWFVLDEPGLHGFWMKDMGFPIDLVWVGPGLTVLRADTAQPCRQADCPVFYPPAPVVHVLETNAGEFRGKPGDAVTWHCGP